MTVRLWLSRGVLGVVPIGDVAVHTPNEPDVPVLADHPSHRSGERVAQSVDRAVAGADAVGRFPDLPLPFQVQGPADGNGCGQCPRNLPTEAQNLEPLAHHYRPVHGRQGGYEVRQLEDRLVELGDPLIVGLLVLRPADRSGVGWRVPLTVDLG